MVNSGSVRDMDDLAIVGGHPALDLVNTVHPRLPVPDPDARDRLPTPADLLAWAPRAACGSARSSAAAAAGSSSTAAAMAPVSGARWPTAAPTPRREGLPSVAD